MPRTDWRRIRDVWVLVVLLFAVFPAQARADAALLMEEPYGRFGSLNPTGHAAIYFNHICAETPTELRPCEPGENGVVMSRYHKISGYDWIAIPLVPYLYAVENVQEIPPSVDAVEEAKLRDSYRRQHLLEYALNLPEGMTPRGEWTQLIGASYDRRIYGFQFRTTAEQEASVIARFNDRRNRSHFNLLFHNCADFSRDTINLFYPHAVHRNFLVDVGLTTPKQVSRSLTKYAKKHPELELSTFMIPQVPGSIRRSQPIDGVVESVVKSKKYVVPLAVLNPEVTAGLVVAYLTDGRYHAPKDAQAVVIPREPEPMTAPPAQSERTLVSSMADRP